VPAEGGVAALDEEDLPGVVDARGSAYGEQHDVHGGDDVRDQAIRGRTVRHPPVLKIEST
jgi:hypothetical protein